MIWTTAKLTEVKQAPDRPTEPLEDVGAGGRADRATVVAAAGDRVAPSGQTALVLAAPARRDGGSPASADRPVARAACERRLEVGEQVVEVLEPDRARGAGPAVIPALGEGRVVELAVGRRRRVGDDREDAAERRRPLRDRQRVDERPAGRAAAVELERRASRRRPASWRRATSCWGWLGSDGW